LQTTSASGEVGDIRTTALFSITFFFRTLRAAGEANDIILHFISFISSFSSIITNNSLLAEPDKKNPFHAV
jgi:hypothetical protein